MPVSGVDDMLCVFRANEQSRPMLVSRNDREQAGVGHVFVAVGPTWQSAVDAALQATKHFVARQVAAQQGEQETTTGTKTDELAPKEQALEDLHDGFTYCTWNGLGQDLTPAKIFESLDVLKKNEIDISNLTIPYQNAWRAAMAKHFGGKTIACIAQIPQVVFHNMMRSDMPKLLMRNSDDFFSDEPRYLPYLVTLERSVGVQMVKDTTCARY